MQYNLKFTQNVSMFSVKIFKKSNNNLEFFTELNLP